MTFSKLHQQSFDFFVRFPIIFVEAFFWDAEELFPHQANFRVRSVLHVGDDFGQESLELKQIFRVKSFDVSSRFFGRGFFCNGIVNFEGFLRIKEDWKTTLLNQGTLEYSKNLASTFNWNFYFRRFSRTLVSHSFLWNFIEELRHYFDKICLPGSRKVCSILIWGPYSLKSLKQYFFSLYTFKD